VFRKGTIVLGFAMLAMLVVATAANASSSDNPPGAVYTLTNSPSGNAVVAFARSADGTLLPQGTVATGGNGSGAALGSQGAVVLSDDGRQLFAVNTGSNSVSSFAVRPGGLELEGTVASGGRARSASRFVASSPSSSTQAVRGTSAASPSRRMGSALSPGRRDPSGPGAPGRRRCRLPLMAPRLSSPRRRRARSTPIRSVPTGLPACRSSRRRTAAPRSVSTSTTAATCSCRTPPGQHPRTPCLLPAHP
jgi:hypothetical protein